jgi:acetyltransferase-like isoleucine patch superfamily enzyme
VIGRSVIAGTLGAVDDAEKVILGSEKHSSARGRSRISSRMSGRTMAQRIGGWINTVRSGASCVWELEARIKGAQVGARVRFVGRPLVSMAAGSRLQLGDGVVLNSALRANPLGCAQPCVLRTLASNAVLELGTDCGLSGAVVCALGAVRIGEGTLLGAGAVIIDNDFHRPTDNWRWVDARIEDARPVTIGRGAFIGTRAVILKGVTVGDRAIIGAGAVVSIDVPARHLAVGNPAQVRPIPEAYFAGTRDEA